MKTAPIILASASDTRAAMLRAAGVVIEVLPANIDEMAVKQGLQAENAGALAVADTLAELKALRISARMPGVLVLGADQTLTCRGKLFDKPAHMQEARDQLALLQGETHELVSAAVIALDGTPIWRHAGRARLKMRVFSDAFLDTYLEAVGANVLESVGCYQLEGWGAQLFARVQGDYFTILGLPLLEILGFLRMRGVLVE